MGEKMTTTCPVCRQENTLAEQELEPNLNASQCRKCGGMWITSRQYETWLSLHGENLPEKPAEEGVKIVSGEVRGAKFCPDCQFILVGYKVGHEVGFSLNRCGHCGGIWFDKNEWEILKSRNLHDDVHLIFSQAWQSSIRTEERKTVLDEILREQLGDTDFTEIQRIKRWLQNHPNSMQLYSYLLSGREDAKRVGSGRPAS